VFRASLAWLVRLPRSRGFAVRLAVWAVVLTVGRLGFGLGGGSNVWLVPIDVIAGLLLLRALIGLRERNAR
jgi:hypothetical protein